MTRTKLPMICRCGDERRSDADWLRAEVKTHLADGDTWSESWELDSLIIGGLNEADYRIASVDLDQWFLVVVENWRTKETASIEADTFLDALCGLYRHVAMEVDR